MTTRNRTFTLSLAAIAIILAFGLLFSFRPSTAFAQDPTPTGEAVQEVISRQAINVAGSADSGDPFSTSLFVGCDPFNCEETQFAVLTEAGNFFNIEHPEENGGIIGEIFLFNPDLTDEQVVATANALMVDPTRSEATRYFFGESETLALFAPEANFTVETAAEASDFWTMGAPVYEEEAIEITGAVWTSEPLPLALNMLTCGADELCLFQGWDSLDSSVAYHIGMASGTTYELPIQLEGTIFRVNITEVVAENVSQVYARFAQMSREVHVRDEVETVHLLYVGTPVPFGWTSAPEFFTGDSGSGGGGDADVIGTVGFSGARLRSYPSVAEQYVIVFLPEGTNVEIIAQYNWGTALWYNVRLSDATEGWIYSQNLIISESDRQLLPALTDDQVTTEDELG